MSVRNDRVVFEIGYGRGLSGSNRVNSISGADLGGPMWTTESRPRRPGQGCYPSDLTDEEWSLVEPLIPPAKRGGRKPGVVVGW